MIELVEGAVYVRYDASGGHKLVIHDSEGTLTDSCWDGLVNDGVSATVWYEDELNALPNQCICTPRKYLEDLVKEEDKSVTDVKIFLLEHEIPAKIERNFDDTPVTYTLYAVNGEEKTKVKSSKEFNDLSVPLMEMLDTAQLIMFLTEVCGYTVLPLMMDTDIGPSSFVAKFTDDPEYKLVGYLTMCMDDKCMVDLVSKINMMEEEGAVEYMQSVFDEHIMSVFQYPGFIAEYYDEVAVGNNEYSLVEISEVYEESEIPEVWNDAIRER